MPRRSRSRSPISSSSRRRSSRRSPSPSPPRKHSSASRMRSDQIGEKSALQRIQVSGGEGGGGARSGVSTHKDKEKKVPKEIRQLQDRVRKDLLEDDGDVERKFLALGSLTRSEQGYIFKGAEFEDVSPKELRKIQIDIRRSIPAHRISNSTIKRRITDPADVVMPRNKSETRPLFVWVRPCPELPVGQSRFLYH